ncbi:MAG: hypothetical protein JNL83_03885 [Myxococcales bacterium]|nr:hypothetical protein [Myxococcales bacterium]
MVRSLLAIVLALAACDEAKQKADKAVDTVKNNSAVQKVDKALDNLDLDEVKQHLASAKDAIGRGLEAAEDCAYAARIADDVVKDAMKDPVAELRRLCSFDAPLGRATKAVVAAEKAKADQPEAPSYTECSSDEWAKAKRDIEAGPHKGDARWTELQARWTKVCPR